MLQQFSWGHFLAASVVVNLVWYGFLVLVCYRKAFLGYLARDVNGPAITQTSSSSRNHQNYSGIGQADLSKGEQMVEGSLMGISKLPDGVQVLSCSQVAFSGGDDRYEQVGLVADLVQELKIIFLDLEKTAGDKRDFFRLLAKVKEEYGPLSGHPSLGAINEFIAGRVGFLLSPEEMDNLWY